MRRFTFFAVSLLLLASFTLSCSSSSDSSASGSSSGAKISLWNEGAKLRGANIWQTKSYNGTFSYHIGSAEIGPAFTQSDFDQMSELGANYVNISHPGLYSETAPYQVDAVSQANLDNLLSMIQAADMFAVISFRTGPGRSEFTFSRDEAGDWFSGSQLDESVWTNSAAQDAWVEMWRYTAGRYAENPVVAGLDLMVEPNSSEISGVDDPEDFNSSLAGSIWDWNQLYPRLVAAVRSVHAQIPIIVGGNGYSSVAWFPYLARSSDPAIVYAVHQYEPFEQYTHQSPWGANSYPGSFDTDYDGSSDSFDRAWLESLFSRVNASGAPLVVNEFGVMRWVPGGDGFMRDTFEIFEARGWSHALWMWYPASFPAAEGEFNFRFGPDPANQSNVASSSLIEVIQANWGKNSVRPSNF